MKMKSQDTYTGWDFVTIWAMDSSVNEGYPYGSIFTGQP